ncbi:cupin domain-containing protein, partial [Cronobacter sakazakii]|uniref:cupin domain-containing protein n=1 Tax=Cronobacter sakazakii TaxID=28141 RepID=UPI001EFD84BF
APGASVTANISKRSCSSHGNTGSTSIVCWASNTVRAPGAQSDSTPHERGVTEHVVVIEGELELQTDGVWRRLGPGEGLKFAGDRPHAYRNATSLPARFHSLIHYPAP